MAKNMTSKATALEAALETKIPLRRDKVAWALDQLGDQYIETFHGACNQDFSNPMLAAALSNDSGLPIKAAQVQHYRTKLREGRL